MSARLGLAALLAAGLGFAACGSSGNSSSSTTTTNATATTSAPETIPPPTTAATTPAAQTASIPNVVGMKLDQAEGTLGADHITDSVSGGGTFGIVVKSNWTVCTQNPAAGASGSSVTLVVARACQ
jgi:ABC-type glycerol-3-phosphate transport system substrate-binding protein